MFDIKIIDIKVGYSDVDKKWMAWIEFDRPVLSGSGAAACTGNTYKEAVDKVLQAGSVEEYFEMLKKEAEHHASTDLPPE